MFTVDLNPETSVGLASEFNVPIVGLDLNCGFEPYVSRIGLNLDPMCIQ